VKAKNDELQMEADEKVVKLNQERNLKKEEARPIDVCDGNFESEVLQLIDASSDAHLWVDKYSGTLDDVFDIQKKVSQSIVKALKLKLTPGESQSRFKVNKNSSLEHLIFALKSPFGDILLMILKSRSDVNKATYSFL